MKNGYPVIIGDGAITPGVQEPIDLGRYTTDEVIQRLQILSDDIESLDAMGEFSKDSVLGLIQEKIKGLRLEQNND